MHSLAIKAREGTEYRGQKKKRGRRKTQRTGENRGEKKKRGRKRKKHREQGKQMGDN